MTAPTQITDTEIGALNAKAIALFSGQRIARDYHLDVGSAKGWQTTDVGRKSTGIGQVLYLGIPYSVRARGEARLTLAKARILGNATVELVSVNLTTAAVTVVATLSAGGSPLVWRTLTTALAYFATGGLILRVTSTAVDQEISDVVITMERP